MDCTISVELQKQMLDFIASYIEHNKNDVKNKDFVDKMMGELYGRIQGLQTPTYYHINAVSMIPFLIEANFMRQTKGSQNKLYEKYNDLLSGQRNYIKELTDLLSGDKWISNFFKITKTTYKGYTNNQEDANRELDILRLKVAANQFKVMPKVTDKTAINGQTVYVADDKYYIGESSTDKVDEKYVTTINDVTPQSVDDYVEVKAEIEPIPVSKDDVHLYKQAGTDDVFKIYFEAFSSYSEMMSDAETPLFDNSGYQFYLNIRRPNQKTNNDKSGYIKHTTTGFTNIDGEKQEVRMSEASDLEKQIIDAYIATGGNLYMRRLDNGDYEIFSPKYVYDKRVSKKVKRDEQRQQQKVETPKIEANLITLPYIIRTILKPEGGFNVTTQASKDYKTNTIFAQAVSKSLSEGKPLEISGRKIYLTAKKGVIAGKPFNQNISYNEPFVLTACDSNGDVVKFKVDGENLTIASDGEEVVFDMFPAYFSSFFNQSKEYITEQLDKLKNKLYNDGAGLKQASDIVNNINTIFISLSNIGNRVLNGEKIIFEPTDISLYPISYSSPVRKLNEADTANIFFNNQKNNFILNDSKSGRSLTIESNYNEKQAEAMVNSLFVNEMPFADRKNMLDDTFNNHKIGKYTIKQTKSGDVEGIGIFGLKGCIAFYPSNSTNCVVFDQNLVQSLTNEILAKPTQFGNVIQITPDFNKAKKGEQLMTPFSSDPMEFYELPLSVYNVQEGIDPVIMFSETTAKPDEDANKTADEANKVAEKEQPKDELIELGDDFNLFKTIKQKEQESKATKEQMEQAEEWYKSSPLSKVVGIEEMFGVVSSTSVAKFKTSGITLLSGSDYTDAYHEAWHAFSQLFMSLDEKKKMYESVKKQEGSFTDYDGKKVNFKDASYKQIEEYLAEEFRAYMLKNRTKQRGFIKRFFDKIKSILHNLFGTKRTTSPEELFEKLRVGDISEYTADRNNVMFDELQKSIVTKSKESNLSMRDSYDLRKLMDIYISEYQPIDRKYRNLVPKSLSDVCDVLEIVSKEIETTDEKTAYGKAVDAVCSKYGENKENKVNELRDMFKTITGSKSSKATELPIDNASAFLSSKSRIISAYTYSLARLYMRKIELQKQLKGNITKYDKVRLESQLRTIENGITNFGEIKKLDSGDYGLVKYHYDRYFSNLDFYDSEVDLEDEEKPNHDNYYDDKNNSKSVEQRIGNDTVLKFILSTIPAYSLEQEGNKYVYKPVVNEYGEHVVKEFSRIKNRLNVMLSGSASGQEMYDRLCRDAYEYGADGKPIVGENGRYVVHNPMTAIIINKLGDPNDNSFLPNREIMRKNELWESFRNTLSCPTVRLHEIMLSKKSDPDVEGGEIVTLSVSESNGPIWKMDDYYKKNFSKVATTKFTKNGIALDLEKIINDFIGVDLKKELTDGITMRDFTPRLMEKLNSISDEDKKKLLPGLIRACGLSITLDSKNIDDLNLNLPNGAFNDIIGKVISCIDNDAIITDAVNDFWKAFKKNQVSLGEIYRIIKNTDIQYTDGVNTEMVKNAEGNTLFMNQQNNSMTVIFNNLRNCKNYQEVLDNPVLRHLDIRKYVPTGEKYNGYDVFEYNELYNPNCAGSAFINKLFRSENSGVKTHDVAYIKVGDEYRKVERFDELIPIDMTSGFFTLDLVNLSGIKVRKDDDEKAQNLFSADFHTKVIADYILMTNNEQEVMRHADNSVSYSVSLKSLGKNFAFFTPYTNTTDWFKPSDPRKSYVVPSKVLQEIVEGIQHQLERVLIVREYKKRAKDPEFAYDRSYLDKFDVEWLGVFDDMLTPETKEKLFDYIKNLDYADQVDISSFIGKYDNDNGTISEGILKDVTTYFEKTINKEKDALYEAIDSVDIDNFTSILFDKFKIKGIENEEDKVAAMATYYIYNSVLYNISCMQTIYNDVMVFNHDKDEFTKRIKGMGSSGKIPGDDAYTNANLALMSQTSYNVQTRNSNDPLVDDFGTGTIRTAICSDIFPVSAYADAYKNISSKYGVIEEESNAQGIITFDAYRYMCMRLGKWSDAKENLFQKICKGEEITEEDTVTFFPVLKLQFNGPLYTGLMPLQAFHKYSLYPVVPTMAKGKNLEAVHNKMLDEGISYLTFNSGSKEACISRDDIIRQGEYNGKKKEKFKEVYDGQYGDKLYDPNSLDINNRLNIVDGKAVIAPRKLNIEMLNPDRMFFTPNVIPIQYIKDQVEIHDELDRSTIFATQMRRQITNNLMIDGYPADLDKSQRKEFDNADDKGKRKMSKCYDRMQNYLDAVSSLTKNAIENLERQFGMEDGKFNDAKFFNYIKKELIKKNIPEYALENIENLTQLQFGPYKDQVEKIIISLVNRNVIRQHIHGGMYVQASGTLFEDAQNPQFGTNDLKFYGISSYTEYEKEQVKVVKDGETEPATIKIPLAGDFAKLLQAKDNEGNVIGNLKKLNECLRDNEWVNKNLDALTIVACRIPVQGYNSIENFRIAEFLAPGCNNIVVCPSELVIKSGGDYDVDKLSMATPNIKIVNGDIYVPRKGKTKDNGKNIKDIAKERSNVYNLLKTNVPEKLNHIITHVENAADVQKAKAFQERIYNVLDRIDDINDELEESNKSDDPEKFDKSHIAELKHSLNDTYKELTKIFREIISDEGFGSEYKAKGTGVSFASIRKKIDTYDKLSADIAEIQANEIKMDYDASKAGLENNCISAMSDILKMDIVYNSLLTPNQTDKFVGEGKPATMLADNAKYNRFENKNNPKYEAKKGKFHMSPTRVVEPEYNRQKQEDLHTGKTILGPVAIDGSFAPEAKAIGLKLSYSSLKVEDHKYKDKVVLAAEEVADLKLHPYKRGIVYDEVKKKLVEMGVDVKKDKEAKDLLRSIASFMNQRLYLSHNVTYENSEPHINMSMKFSADGKDEISDINSQLMNGCVDVAKNPWISSIEGNTETIATITFMDQCGVPVEEICYFVTNPLVKQYIDMKIAAKSSLSVLEEESFISVENKIRCHMLGIKSVKKPTDKILVEINNMIDNSATGYNFDLNKLKDIAINNKDDKDYNRRVLLHFMRIEDMSKSTNSFKLGIRVDGSKANSVYDIMSRQKALEKIENDERLDTSTVRKIRTESVLSSFFVEDLVTSIINTTIPEKLDPSLLKKFDGIQSETIERSDLYDRFFGDFPSYLYQKSIKDIDDTTALENKDVMDIINSNNGKVTLFHLPERLRNSVSKAIERMLPYKKGIPSSKIFRTWVIEHMGESDDFFDKGSENYDKEMVDEYVSRFIYYNALHEVGYGNALFSKYNDMPFSDNPLSIVSKYMLIKQLIGSNRALKNLFSSFTFFNKINGVSMANDKVGLLFDAEMDDDQKAVVFEEYNTLIGSSEFNEAFNEANISEYDKKFILDFFNSLPYFSLVQSGLSSSSTALTCMFDLSNPMQELYNEYVEKTGNAKAAVVNEYTSMFEYKLRQGGYYDFEENSLYSEDNIVEDEEQPQEQQTTQTLSEQDEFGGDTNLIDQNPNAANESNDSCEI